MMCNHSAFCILTRLMKHLRHLFIAFIILTFSSPVFSTHIVGGEMNYRCLGNQQYEVILTVYRDCYYGVPFFDNPASVGVFDAGGGLVANLLIPFVEDDTLKPILSGDCFIVPPNACVHTTTYRSVVTLPVSPGGYTLAYQRCCRNQTILNIEQPDSTGATFSIFISEEAILECNSSPTFKEWPPIYICVNEPILFDHSAIDEEEDSIVYRLCTPFNGGLLGNPQPVPPAKPPYNEIIWRDPPYNLNNVMGGIPLTIDPVTGQLTGTPNTVGQFVVGVCADEYRDGMLISSTRRDFQYNVGICGMTVSAFTVPEINCGMTVNFTNFSANADTFQWYFDLDNDPTATSNEYSPSYTYPDSGFYTVMLIAQPSDKCVDTFIQVIRVERLSIVADFDFNFPFCADSLTLNAIDKSTDTLSTIISWEWRLTSGTTKAYTSTEQFPTFQIDTAGIWILNLVVTAENGCKDTLREIFPVRLATLPWADTTFKICLGDSIFINPNPGTGSGVSYSWTPQSFLINPNTVNPLAFPDTSIVYTVKTSSMNGICKDQRMVTVEVSPPLVISPPSDTTICENPFWVEGIADRPATWTWALDPAFQNIISVGNPVLLDIPFSSMVYIHVVDDAGCEALDSFYVTNFKLEFDLIDTFVLCPGEGFALEVFLTDPLDTLVNVSWNPSVLFPGGNTMNPATIYIPDPGEYTITVEAENQLGCSRLDSIFVSIIDTLATSAIIDVSNCSGFKVFFQLNTPGSFDYHWSFGDASNPGYMANGSAVTYEYPGPGSYPVTAYVQSDGACQDTIHLLVTLIEPAIIPDFMWNYETCSDTAIINLTDISTNTQASILDRKWFVNGSFAGIDSTILWTINQTGLQNITLILVSDNGCIDTLVREVNIPFITIVLPDTVSICPGDSVQLNLNGDPNYSYVWNPGSSLNDTTAVSPWASPAISTLYSVSISFTTPDTCRLDESILVLVQQEPSIYVPSDTLVCDDVVLLVANADPGTTIHWFGDPDFTQLLAEGPTFLSPVVEELNVYLEFIDNMGCRYFDSVIVQSAFLDLVLPDSAFRCFGDTLIITSMIVGDTSGLNITWDGNGMWEVLSDGYTVVIPPNGAAFTLSGIVENSKGCSASDAVNIIVFSNPPVIQISADPSIVLPGGSTQLFAPFNPGWNYSWSPEATLSDPAIWNPVATPTENIVYSVLITDEFGCQGVDDILVRLASTICDEPYIFVPNTFTPNSDNLNDKLFVRGNFIDELYFIIYDRWGNQVFATRDKNTGWDGTYRGTLSGTDVFGYYLEARCFNGETFVKKGNVTVLRN